MSNWAMTAIFENSRTKGSARLVLLALADLADNDGVCWPANSRTAKRANVGLRQARRLVSRLITDAELVRLRGGGGRGHGNRLLVRAGRSDAELSAILARETRSAVTGFDPHKPGQPEHRNPVTAGTKPGHGGHETRSPQPPNPLDPSEPPPTPGGAGGDGTGNNGQSDRAQLVAELSAIGVRRVEHVANLPHVTLTRARAWIVATQGEPDRERRAGIVFNALLEGRPLPASVADEPVYAAGQTQAQADRAAADRAEYERQDHAQREAARRFLAPLTDVDLAAELEHVRRGLNPQPDYMPIRWRFTVRWLPEVAKARGWQPPERGNGNSSSGAPQPAISSQHAPPLPHAAGRLGGPVGQNAPRASNRFRQCYLTVQDS